MILTIENIENELRKKFAINEQLIIYTYYELRVELNLSKIETNRFLELIKTKLENLQYKVYMTGEMYIFDNHSKVVKENELLVAIKMEEIY